MALQTYLEQNEGPGLQHLALKTNDVLGAVRKMRRVSGCGGFDFMPPASPEYYKCVRVPRPYSFSYMASQQPLYGFYVGLASPGLSTACVSAC